MKIAHIAPPWIAIPPKNYGGTETFLYNLIEEQVAQGHDVTLLAPGDAQTSAKLVSFFPQALLDSGVSWLAHLKAYYHIHKAIAYVKTHQFDILHTNLSSCADMYVFPLAANLPIPMVTTLHSRFPFDRVQSWTGDADRYYLEWLSTVSVVAISESARAEVPYDLNFAGVVYHGLPMNIFKPTVERPENFLVWLGRIVPEKGVHCAISAAKAAGIPLVLAGTVDPYTPEAVRYFEEMIKPQIDNEQVKYIGPVDMQQKIDLLSHARGFLNPIEWEEPFGMVMIEAMSVGCPVISFARGAAPEIIVHGKTGFLVHNVGEMVHFIPRIDKLARKAVRAHVEQNFSVGEMAKKYIKVYKRVMASSLRSKVTIKTPSISASASALITPTPGFKTVEAVQDRAPFVRDATAATEAGPLP
jgi:glycosyltransferase involved in cell wall biosynthesis